MIRENSSPLLIKKSVDTPFIPQQIIVRQTTYDYQKETPEIPLQRIPSLQRRRDYSQKEEPKKGPWWLFLIGGVLTIIVVLAGVYFYFLHRNNPKPQPIKDSIMTSVPLPIKCEPGYIVDKGRCIKCPVGFKWNGTDCAKQPSLKADSKDSLSSADAKSKH